MPGSFPAPDVRHPLIFPDGTTHQGTVFLKSVIDHPRWQVGNYTYASTFDPPPDNWAKHLAPYLLEASADTLTIGRFCQIADGVQFITSSANHRYDGFSTYPFAIFDGFDPERPSLPDTGPDMAIGNDVWIGQGARILPGGQIGDGTIIGAGAVAGGMVPPYSVVVGNPGRVVHRRFDAATIERLLRIAWWTWPIERILAHEAAICGADLSELEAAA